MFLGGRQVSQSDFDLQAERLTKLSHELKQAIGHAEIAKSHFLNAEVPRACAHALALEGNLEMARELLSSIAKTHREKSPIQEF